MRTLSYMRFYSVMTYFLLFYTSSSTENILKVFTYISYFKC